MGLRLVAAGKRRFIAVGEILLCHSLSCRRGFDTSLQPLPQALFSHRPYHDLG